MYSLIGHMFRRSLAAIELIFVFRKGHVSQVKARLQDTRESGVSRAYRGVSTSGPCPSLARQAGERSET